eukprot:GHVS01088693.1.p1 GENE.GHVS01088693.1~~GHVS01088693.1.p1  ORF type:complete len:168 (+),score=13.74 GHVS01088693.1:150-653(+)
MNLFPVFLLLLHLALPACASGVSIIVVNNSFSGASTQFSVVPKPLGEYFGVKEGFPYRGMVHASFKKLEERTAGLSDVVSKMQNVDDFSFYKIPVGGQQFVIKEGFADTADRTKVEGTDEVLYFFRHKFIGYDKFTVPLKAFLDCIVNVDGSNDKLAGDLRKWITAT